MSSRLPRAAKIGWLRALVRYYRDPSASVLGKLVIFAALIYAIVPVDLVPDVPVIGWLDDLGVMGLASAWLGRVVARYRMPPIDERHPVPGSSAAAARRPFSVSP